ncbi:MAG TPA: hypothetical protein VK172_09015 [Lentimicrobium sp.]|nr:hypothetical protein [Lentimicrobium sp.]
MKHFFILASLIFAACFNSMAQTDPVKPFVTNIEIGYAHGYMEQEYDYYGLDVAHSFNANPHFSTGLGIGLHNYSWGFPGSFNANIILPIYLDFRYYPLTGKFAPYALVKGGYAIAISDKIGMFAQTGVGLKYSYSGKNSLFLNLTYGIQSYHAYKNSYDYGKFIEALGLALGLSFR